MSMMADLQKVFRNAHTKHGVCKESSITMFIEACGALEWELDYNLDYSDPDYEIKEREIATKMLFD